MLKSALSEINLETLDTYQFKYDGNLITIKMVGTIIILNSIGDWKDFVALNINTMIGIMQKYSTTSIDMGMCFPDKGVGYNVNVVIEKELPLIEVAPNAFVEIQPDTENKTVSRRGRKAKSDV